MVGWRKKDSLGQNKNFDPNFMEMQREKRRGTPTLVTQTISNRRC